MARHAPRPASSAPRNPFIIGQHAEGDGFADRTQEVAKIAAAFRDPSSRLLVYGDRRLGKSSVIRAAAAKVRAQRQAVAVVDLGSATSVEAAAQRVLSAVHREVGERWRDVAIRAAARLKGTVTVTPTIDASGNMSMAFALTPGGAAPGEVRPFTAVLDAIESELEGRDLHLALALDEFQRLRNWCGADIDWPLKEMLERHRRIAYVLAGSERTLIEQMLENKKAGLWKVVEIFPIQPIDAAVLAQWLIDRAAATGLTIAPDAAAVIVRIAGPRTRDIVQLGRQVWDLRHDIGTASQSDVVVATDTLVQEQGALYQGTWDRLNDVERRILLLVAADRTVQLTAAEVLRRYQLGPKTTVHRAVNDLVLREFLLPAADGRHTFDDPFFRRWIQLNVLEDISRTPPPLVDGDEPV